MKTITTSTPAHLKMSTLLGSTSIENMLSVRPVTQAANHIVKADLQLYRLISVSENDGFSLHLLAPGKSWKTRPENFRSGYQITFTEEILLITGCRDFHPFSSSAIHLSSMPPVVCPNNQVGQRIEQIIVAIANALQEPGLMRDPILGGLIKVLLAYISRQFESAKPAVSVSEDEQIYDAFIELLGSQQNRLMGISDYAAALKVSQTSLAGAVRRVSGYSARYHIHQRLVQSAKQAAIGSRASMKEVAYSLGFPDMAHFSKFFRNKAGMTFSNYKKAFQLI